MSNYKTIPGWPGTEPKVKREKAAKKAKKTKEVLHPLPVNEVALSTDRPGVLVMNTYAGSLLLAARQVGAEVVGSYEDVGFGQQWQVANFPELAGRFASERSAWPEQDLSGVVAIAHPPCAAFSVQGIGTKLRHGGKIGVESEHFKCTIEVANYAMGHGVKALAVESVPGALEGGREMHDQLAAQHGYRVFRILQNSATFGVPQWRPRFWVVFARDVVRIAINAPLIKRTVRDVLESMDPGPQEAEQERRLEFQKAHLVAQGWDAEKLLRMPGMLAGNIRNEYLPDLDTAKVCEAHCLRTNHGSVGGRPLKIGYKFLSSTIRVLDPEGCAGVVQAITWFAYQGRNITPAEYRALTGFPRDYILDRDYRLWLSKGVVPQVGAWILDTMLKAVEGNQVDEDTNRTFWLESGETVDLRLTKEQWAKLPSGRSA